MLEIKDERLVEAEAGQYLDVFCVGIIHNIWGKRHNVKRYDKGKTSPLFDVSNFSVPDIPEPEYDEIPYNQERDDSETELQRFIKEYLESKDVNERFRSRVFYYSNFKFKNVRQFSKASGIPYQICVRAYQVFKQKIKEEICIKKY